VLKRRENDRGKTEDRFSMSRRCDGFAAFSGMTAGAGGWRVAIIDSADEMNDNAANALLKVLGRSRRRGPSSAHQPRALAALLPPIRRARNGSI
jgi:DNA polymerase III delta prime subunit